MTKKLTLTIEGEFTAFELAALYSFIRGLDRDARHWTTTVIDEEGTTLKEALALLKKMVPEVPGRQTTFEVHRKQ
jgi:hypothetical protein